MIYEAQNRETISDSLKIGCVIAGMGQSRLREHLLLSATKCDKWTNFVREIESIEHAKKTISAPTPMELDAFQGNCHKCGKHGHTAKECRSSSHGGQKSLGVRCVKNMVDSVGHGAARHPTKIHRKEDGKVTEKETAREPRRVASPKEEKAETKGKGKGKGKVRKVNVSMKSQNLPKSRGQVDLGNNGQINLGMLEQTLRFGGKMIGTQQIRILKHRSELSNLVLIPLHAKLLFLPITLLHVNV